MSSLNKAMIIGRLGQDPELKYAKSGTAVCELSVATSRKNKRTGEEKTEWHRVVVWDKAAENCAKYLAKGRQVYVEGELETRTWEGKNGEKRSRTEIRAFAVQFLGGGRDEGRSGGRGRDDVAPAQSDSGGGYDDLPF